MMNGRSSLRRSETREYAPGGGGSRSVGSTEAFSSSSSSSSQQQQQQQQQQRNGSTQHVIEEEPQQQQGQEYRTQAEREAAARRAAAEEAALRNKKKRQQQQQQQKQKQKQKHSSHNNNNNSSSSSSKKKDSSTSTNNAGNHATNNGVAGGSVAGKSQGRSRSKTTNKAKPARESLFERQARRRERERSMRPLAQGGEGGAGGTSSSSSNNNTSSSGDGQNGSRNKLSKREQSDPMLSLLDSMLGEDGEKKMGEMEFVNSLLARESSKQHMRDQSHPNAIQERDRRLARSMYGSEDTVMILRARSKRLQSERLSFLLGFHPAIGFMSPLYHSFLKQEHFDRHVVRQIFQFLEPNSHALLHRGMRYYCYGYADQDDMVKAVRYFKAAAYAGHPCAFAYLGQCYRHSYGVWLGETEKRVAAAKCYMAGLQHRHGPCEYWLAMCYLLGDGVERDEQKADELFKTSFRHLERLAKKGHAESMYLLGLCYNGGLGTRSSYKYALAWFKRAAEYGHSDALYMVADYYYFGYGVNKDRKEADTWYNRAAQRGNRMAEMRTSKYSVVHRK